MVNNITFNATHDLILALIHLFTANEDYLPLSQTLQFSVVSQDTQCLSLSLLDDTISEDDENFLVLAGDTNLIQVTNNPVQVVIQDDDCMLRYHCIVMNYLQILFSVLWCSCYCWD